MTVLWYGIGIFLLILSTRRTIFRLSLKIFCKDVSETCQALEIYFLSQPEVKLERLTNLQKSTEVEALEGLSEWAREL